MTTATMFCTTSAKKLSAKKNLLPKTRTLRVAEADVQWLLNVNFVFLLSRTEQNTRYAWEVASWPSLLCIAHLRVEAVTRPAGQHVARADPDLLAHLVRQCGCRTSSSSFLRVYVPFHILWAPVHRT